MTQKRLYEAGYQLKDNEYLLKIRPADRWNPYPTGFLSKLTQKGELPKSFLDWGKERCWKNGNLVIENDPEIFVVEENFRSSWKLIKWRFGQSQNWATMLHPDGYTVEIYLQQFLEILQNNTVINSEIQGEFKWQDKKLITNKT